MASVHEPAAISEMKPKMGIVLFEPPITRDPFDFLSSEAELKHARGLPLPMLHRHLHVSLAL